MTENCYVHFLELHLSQILHMQIVEKYILLLVVAFDELRKSTTS
jgi:hypothetical protein